MWDILIEFLTTLLFFRTAKMLGAIVKKNNIIKEAIAIARQRENVSLEQSVYYLEKAENILLEYLKSNSQDTDAWLLLIRIEWNTPLEDSDRIIAWANNILDYDPTNVYALLFLCEAYCTFRGDIPEEIYYRLCQIQCNDLYIRAMIEIAKANYLVDKANMESEYEKVLKKSIEYGPEQIRNYQMLGNFYIKKGAISKGEQLLKISKLNAQQANRLYKEYIYDPTNIIDLLNEFYTGL